MSKNYLKEDESVKLTLLEKLGVPLDDFKRDVEILKDWAKQQKHLPQDFLDDDSFVERLLLNNKFRIEQSKTKYDNYFTIKGLYNSKFDGIENIAPSNLAITKIPLRKTTDDGKKLILIAAVKSPQINKDFEDCMKFQLAVSEIMNKYCFCDGRIVILDFEDVKRGIFKNFDFMLLVQHLKIIRSAFSGRVSAVHVINATNFTIKIISALKMILQGGGISKIKVHESVESFHKEIPQEYLPEEYGGKDISLKKYLDIWDEIIREEETFLKNLRNQVPDESLRIGPRQLNSDGFGVDGTFKKLNLD